MASYADIAAKGPKQSDEEAPAVPEMMHEESGVHSLESLQSVNEHVRSLPSEISYADQQLAKERAEEARGEAEKRGDRPAKEAHQFRERAEAGALGLKKDGKSESNPFGRKTEAMFGQGKDQAKEEWNHAKQDGKKAEDWAETNKNNPVVVGNAVVVAALGALLGTGAYRMHKANTLTWNVVGAWAGAVGLFAVGDYYVSQYLFQKYPTKK